MSELPLMQERIQALRRYMTAMECGDIEAAIAVLNDAEHDQGLEHMLLELNSVYQYEDSTTVRAADKRAAQQLVLTFADQTIGREKMTGQALNDNRDSVLEPVHAAQAELSDATNYPLAKKIQGRKIATPVFPARVVASQKWYSSRTSWIAAAVAAVLLTLLLVPGTSVLASQFLSLFRVQHFQPVQITSQDAATLSKYTAPRIDDLGTLKFQANSFKVHNNLTQVQVEKSVSFSIALPSQLPDGVANSPVFSLVEGGHGVFTFSSAKMQSYLVKNGHANVKIPANLDGATFDFTVTPGVMLKYGYHGGNPFLAVELPSPLIRATGSASLAQLQNFMLSLPGLPPTLIAEMRQINFNNGTIPLPVPAGIDAQSVMVNSTSGLLLSSNKTTTVENIKHFPAGSVVVWQTKGIIYALGGIAINASQLISSAKSIS